MSCAPSETPEMKEIEDSLELARAEADALYNEHEFISDKLPRSNLHIGVSRNDGRNGVCKYNERLTKHRFNKQITQTQTARGHHIVVVNEKILEDGNRAGFIDTLRHEVAHAVCYEVHHRYPERGGGRYSGHGQAWKEMARRLGADDSACHSRRDRSDEYKYYITCTECGMEAGRTKRSKIIKQPFNRKCGKCGHSPLSSYAADQEPPEEDGVVKVPSLDWSNRSEWYDAGSP
jgi:predicted SprT family Zn-dependent metalloprotease